MFEDIFSDRLSKAIRANCYTQKELASKIGISNCTLSRYIKQHHLPTPEILAKIATTLHVTSDFLLGIDGKSTKFEDIISWLNANAEIMTENQKNAVTEILKNTEINRTATAVKQLLEDLSIEYETLAPAHIKCYYPSSNDCTMISVCNKTDISIGGRIIGSIDDLKTHLLNIKYYSS